MGSFPCSFEEEQKLLEDVRRSGAVPLGDGRLSLMTRGRLCWSKPAVDRLRLQVGISRTKELASLIQSSAYWLVDRHLGYAPLPMTDFDALVDHVNTSRLVSWLPTRQSAAAAISSTRGAVERCVALTRTCTRIFSATPTPSATTSSRGGSARLCCSPGRKPRPKAGCASPSVGARSGSLCTSPQAERETPGGDDSRGLD